MIKKHTLIALDMDGTLLNDDKTISAATINYLKDLDQKGYLIVLASGRPLRALAHYQDQLDLSSPLVCYNGALITSRHDREFPTFKSSFKQEIIKNIISDIGLNNLDNVMVETPDDIWLLREDDDLNAFFWHDNVKIVYGDVRANITEDPMTLILKSKVKNPVIDGIITSAIEKYPHYKVRFWYGSDYSEAYLDYVTKRDALKYIADYYHIPHSRTIAFGDAENDIQMLAWANIGVGMLNGNEYCKAHADIITVDDNNHDGIIKTLPLILDKIK